MSLDQIASILWRRRVIFVLALAACVAAVVGVTLSLPKTYKATATLLVQSRSSIPTTDLLNQLTTTYATLAGNPNIADTVAAQLSPPMTRDKLLSRMSFAPVSGTQLLQITAEDSTPSGAETLANAYARTFVEDVAGQLSGAGSTGGTVSISEPAVVPTSPAKPNPPLYIGLGTLLAILLAFAVALLRERLDTRIHVTATDDHVLGQPIMARIPRFASRTETLPPEIADRFGLLKTNLDLFDDRPSRTVMVTSPGIDEGKSTVAASLALTCVSEGERVVIVEADLRRPGLDRTQPLKKNVTRESVGLTSYLIGAAPEREVVAATHDPNLAIVWAGPVPPNPNALLASERFGLLLRSLAERFDRVVVDTPPIVVGADASVLVPQVDGVLYVIDETTTKRRQAEAGLNQIGNVRGRILGIVVNRVKAGAESYHAYYRRRDGAQLLETATPAAPPPQSTGRARRRRTKV